MTTTSKDDEFYFEKRLDGGVDIIHLVCNQFCVVIYDELECLCGRQKISKEKSFQAMLLDDYWKDYWEYVFSSKNNK
jgi:hypothetical protein